MVPRRPVHVVCVEEDLLGETEHLVVLGHIEDPVSLASR